MPPYDESNFSDKLLEIRRLTCKEPVAVMVERAKKLCASAGVAVVVCPAFKGVRASGACYWLGTGSPVIQLSLRYKTEEQLWFSLFHEAGHVVDGHKKGFIDGDDYDDGSEMEERANTFARDLLLPPDPHEVFVRKGDFSATAVSEYARASGVAPGIVVGRLQRDGLLDYDRLSQFRRPLEWM